MLTNHAARSQFFSGQLIEVQFPARNCCKNSTCGKLHEPHLVDGKSTCCVRHMLAQGSIMTMS
jgi:hypothetical protein